MMHHNFLAYPLSLVIWLFGLVPFFFFFLILGSVGKNIHMFYIYYYSHDFPNYILFSTIIIVSNSIHMFNILHL